jgi:hypothetical protein
MPEIYHGAGFSSSRSKMAVFDVHSLSGAMMLQCVHTCAHRDRLSDIDCASMSIAIILDLAEQSFLDGEAIDVHVSRDATGLNETTILVLEPTCRLAIR